MAIFTQDPKFVAVNPESAEFLSAKVILDHQRDSKLGIAEGEFIEIED